MCWVHKGNDPPKDDRDGNYGADPKAYADPAPISSHAPRIQSGVFYSSPRLKIRLLQLEAYYRDN
jgi:hypothetical protein